MWYNKNDAREATQYNFSTQSIVLIKSPTGTGKTTFILNNVVPYLDLINNYKNNPDFYLTLVKAWFKTKSIRHIFSEDCKDFIDFLAYFENKPTSGESAENFYNAFQYYYKRYCVKKFNKNKNLLDKALNIRKGTTQRKATMNKSLKMLNLPYEIKKEKNCWVLRKTE